MWLMIKIILANTIDFTLKVSIGEQMGKTDIIKILHKTEYHSLNGYIACNSCHGIYTYSTTWITHYYCTDIWVIWRSLTCSEKASRSSSTEKSPWNGSSFGLLYICSIDCYEHAWYRAVICNCVNVIVLYTSWR